MLLHSSKLSGKIAYLLSQGEGTKQWETATGLKPH